MFIIAVTIGLIATLAVGMILAGIGRVFATKPAQEVKQFNSGSDGREW